MIKHLKKPLYGGFLPLTGPDAKCDSILRRAHFLSPPFLMSAKWWGLSSYSLPSSA